MSTIGDRTDVVFDLENLVLTLVGWEDWCPPKPVKLEEPKERKAVKEAKIKKPKKKGSQEKRILNNLKKCFSNFKPTSQLKIK